ncbi:hypothetical protein F0L17_10915 [Streptomyces sp. TRM43335]|uniref:Secreted protein n=1 Tax=Streptomyces taklimakanensis TaxID=2569853 RepID=A0A6G2BBJ6_9ACTN|nr:hypothetical protein [Streptomyces taklimakanensis]MTE19630.1 hypothetical protein [Streptomyces taklimakanensis]
MRKTVRFAIASSLTLLLSTAVVFHWKSGGEESGGGQAICDGLLTKEAISPLSIDPEGEYESSRKELVDGPGESGSDSPGRRGMISRCPVWQSEGGIAEFEVFVAWDFGPFRSEPVTPGWYVDASPLGSGLNGWTEGRRAEVWLPQKCSDDFKMGNKPIQVQLELQNPRHGQWGRDDKRRRMAEVLMSYAKNLAQEKGCDEEGFELADEVPGAPVHEEVPVEGQCGLSGFGVTRDQASRGELRQSVVGNYEDGWSCVLTRESESDRKYALAAFAVNGNDQLIAHHRNSRANESEGFQTEFITCGGAEYLVQMSHAESEPQDHDEHERKALEYAEADLLPARVLHESFVDAVKEKLGCAS